MNVINMSGIKRTKPTGDVVKELYNYDLTEDGIAQAFVAMHKDDLRYDHDRGRWYAWDGNLWREERTRLAFDWVRRTCREMSALHQVQTA